MQQLTVTHYILYLILINLLILIPTNAEFNKYKNITNVNVLHKSGKLILINIIFTAVNKYIVLFT